MAYLFALKEITKRKVYWSIFPVLLFIAAGCASSGGGFFMSENARQLPPEKLSTLIWSGNYSGPGRWDGVLHSVDATILKKSGYGKAYIEPGAHTIKYYVWKTQTIGSPGRSGLSMIQTGQAVLTKSEQVFDASKTYIWNRTSRKFVPSSGHQK